MSDGETEAEANINARDAFSVWMSARAHIGKPIPKPTRPFALDAIVLLSYHLHIAV
ncbi:hypothetical protein NTGBS_490038 [Candidatus Nitrotoga sp. BS]|nr:hypothetical protein NTGBS_490038 [Candidatus Nitrotoga sp. BS]